MVSRHAVIDNDLMRLSVAEEVSAVSAKGVGLLGFYQFGQKLAFGLPSAEEVEDGGKVAES